MSASFANIKDGVVLVRFKQEWMGNPVGSELQMWEHAANHLISRGVAEHVVDKSLDVPPVDKMIRQPERKKNFSRIKTLTAG